MAKKTKVNASRRNFLFGAVRRLKGEEVGDGPIAATTETIPLLTRANGHYAAGEYEEATEAYREYLKIEKNDLDVRLQLGKCMYAAGKYAASRVEFKRVLKVREKDSEAIVYLGLTHARNGNLEQAAAAWEDFFDISNVALLRELNLQKGLIETRDAESPELVAEAVEKALRG
ncbi:tetratricopeptide repeat protein [Salidesulfovibrio onnuriiensis]|uniref:tetratricopeptide repeat protein n=1 Tax=Salidesulfovibrio onnuriiensis TaxID=2583823 RepID=UPI0011CB5543|nr:tetratricopeptide repeat protein [Salidesulfovibrio onnuriiensis]